MKTVFTPQVPSPAIEQVEAEGPVMAKFQLVLGLLGTTSFLISSVPVLRVLVKVQITTFPFATDRLLMVVPLPEVDAP